ncbi:hypothetical protein PC129_g18395 [Phytophthora cactorum]|uniref:Uncharacterized protein n=1 Tax=Phytophthora cactorum TaxID=29920 RepID=A0A8T1HDM5_9STRA|nr:hypothetical protein C6341_g27232 [Phytophthora cactorum]KAG3127192.1 hypothetical protein PC128_g27130 [Phytophthora cactorum]KAG3210615.1 hypothetical protein PC129_g18395 [Phytophthora cactorum]
MVKKADLPFEVDIVERSRRRKKVERRDAKVLLLDGLLCEKKNSKVS